MKKLFLSFMLLLACAIGHAQSINQGHAQNTTAVYDQMPAGKMYINLATAPKPWHGSSQVLTRASCNSNTTSYGCDAHDYSCASVAGNWVLQDVYTLTHSNLPSTGATNGLYFVADTQSWWAWTGSAYASCTGDSPNSNSNTNALSPIGAPGTVLGSGSFRINCSIGHFGYDDPIVHPGAPGTTHLHMFTGNTSTSAASVLNDMSEVGSSTCIGGMANASGYWTPVPFYHCPSVATGCDHTRDGEIVKNLVYSNEYYKCNGYGGGDCMHSSHAGTSSAGPAQWAPVGMRMIIGNANATTPFPQNGTGALRFECFNHATSAAGNFIGHIPTPAEAVNSSVTGLGSAPCDEINLWATQPDCWDGVNIDSPDHISHMAFSGTTGPAGSNDGGSGAGCSNPSYPINIATPSMNQHVYVSNVADWAYVRLSSDPACLDEGATKSSSYPTNGYIDNTGTAFLCNGKANNGQPAGWTWHMDWVNGWNHNANFMGWGKGSLTDIIMRACWNVDPVNTLPSRSANDCHDSNLGAPLNNGIYYQVAPLNGYDTATSPY